MNYFDEYAHRYDMTNPKINYKYYHSHRVMDNMEVLAKSLNLPYSDINIAKCIGLLHDMGRFEQYRLYNRYDDDDIDHGDVAVEIIKKEDALKYFDIAKEDYEIVYEAIKNHNKFTFDNTLSKRTALFIKMIRDADKLDILYALSNPDIKKSVYEDNKEISNRVATDFFNNISIKREYQKSLNDNLVTLFAFVYDINLNVSLDIIKTNNYYLKIYKRLSKETQKKLKPYLEHITKYIDERID